MAKSLPILLLASSFPLHVFSISSKKLVLPPPPSYELLVSCSFCSGTDNNGQADLAGKPLQLISTGNSHACHPLSLQRGLVPPRSFSHGLLRITPPMALSVQPECSCLLLTTVHHLWELQLLPHIAPHLPGRGSLHKTGLRSFG